FAGQRNRSFHSAATGESVGHVTWVRLTRLWSEGSQLIRTLNEKGAAARPRTRCCTVDQQGRALRGTAHVQPDLFREREVPGGLNPDCFAIVIQQLADDTGWDLAGENRMGVDRIEQIDAAAIAAGQSVLRERQQPFRNVT